MKDEIIMSVGGGIVLFVLGAILSFAVKANIRGIDLTLIGYILMGAGLVVFLLGLVYMFRRRSTLTTNRVVDAGGAERVEQAKTSSTL